MRDDVALKAAARQVAVGRLALPGDLIIPQNAGALIVFAHGSGSSRLSPRNSAVARAFNARGMAALLFDLLTHEEERNCANVFDIPLLAGRLIEAVHWVDWQPDLADIPIGLFGASTGAAAALGATATLGDRIGAIVSRGGRPDLAASALDHVTAPTLLIVGGLDDDVVGLNKQALARLQCPKALEIVPGATHLFPEPGTMERVIALAGDWFVRHLMTPGTKG